MKNFYHQFCFISLVLILNSFTSLASIHFTESFTSPYIPQTYTTGTVTLSSGTWDLTQVRGELAANSYGSTGGAARLSKSVISYLISPSVNSIGTISFYYRTLNTSSGTFKVQKSINGGTYTDIATQTFNSQTYSLFTITINDLSNNICIKILSDNNPENLIVDEITITDYSLGPLLTTNPTTLTGFNYILGSGPSVSQSFNLSGSALTGTPGNIAIAAPSDYEISSDNMTFSNSVNVAYSSSTLSSTPIYVRLKSGLPVNNYNSELVSITGGGASQLDVSCSGSVSPIPTPVLNVNSSTLSGFTYIIGSGPSLSQSYNLSGTNLTGFPGNILITAPTTYEVSTNNTTFTNSVNVAYTSTTLASTPIYVRLIAGLSINTYNSEIITNAGGGATTTNVTCNGSVTAVPPATLSSNTSTLSGFTYFDGSGPSSSQSYNLSGTQLTGAPGTITITAPTNYEVSTDNSVFSTNVTIPYTSSTLTSTPLYVRLKSSLAIGYYNSEIITNIGGGTSIDITCNGEVKAVSISCASDLIISEYHEPSSGNNKGVEIFNGTGGNVDLSNYYIGVIVNGGTDIESSKVLSGILGDKQTACIYNDADADPNFRLKGNINISWTSATWNGNDAVYLLKGGTTLNYIIDAIGDFPPVTDPGTAFVNNGVSTINTGLIRKSTIQSPTTIWSGLEWNVVAAGTYTNWGIHTMDCPSKINVQNHDVFKTVEVNPNPNNGIFKLVIPNGIEKANIRIINIFGDVVYESELLHSEYNLNFVPGIYIISVFNKQETFIKKFIVY
jgi:hypothetical protein